MTLSRAELPPYAHAWAAGLFGADEETFRALARSREGGEPLHSEEDVERWVVAQRSRRRLDVRRVPLAALDGWHFDPTSGALCHRTGRFFSVDGLRVRRRVGDEEIRWDQPIIEQPEYGILGVLAKTIRGVLHLCLQAKEEPGNEQGIQLSPTLQATYSNYKGVHGGGAPGFLERFLCPQPGSVLFSRLQTEDGARFLFKSNRNMVVRAEEIPETLPEGYRWLTLGQIGRLLERDACVHACTRSVLAPFSLLPLLDGPTNPSSTGQTLGRCMQWLDDRKASSHVVARRIGVNGLEEWGLDAEGCLSHREGRFFRVVGVDVHGEGREVQRWSQPLLESREQGMVGLLAQVVDGRRSFLLRAKTDAGNRPTVQLGPTVEFSPSNYVGNARIRKPFLFDEFLIPDGQSRVLFEKRQAEEGGRFFRECHVHKVLELAPGRRLDFPDDYRWLSAEEVLFFLMVGETLNAAARSILSCLLAPGQGTLQRPGVT